MSAESFPTPSTFRAGSRARQIARLSRALVMFIQAAAVLLPIGVALYWLASPVSALAHDAGLPADWLESFELSQRLLAMLISLVPVAALLWGFVRLLPGLSAFARGELFGPTATRGLRDFSFAMLASAVLGPLSGAALSVVMSWGAPEGQRQLALSVGSDQVLLVLFAVMFALIAWVMAEAAEIARENEEFI